MLRFYRFVSFPILLCRQLEPNLSHDDPVFNRLVVGKREIRSLFNGILLALLLSAYYDAIEIGRALHFLERLSIRQYHRFGFSYQRASDAGFGNH